MRMGVRPIRLGVVGMARAIIRAEIVYFRVKRRQLLGF